MSLPIDLIFVRHGQSEGNVANRASRRGDNSFFTPDFRERHSRTFRLTDKGIEQAEAAGRWLKANVPQPLDRFYVSDYIRAKETAAHLSLPGAQWRSEFHLRERDHALMDNCPDDEKKRLFRLEERQYELDKFLSYPAGGGESIAQLCQRLKATMLEHWARVCSDQRVVAVCHGHVMRAFQMELEHMGHDDFLRLDASDAREDKVRTPSRRGTLGVSLGRRRRLRLETHCASEVHKRRTDGGSRFLQTPRELVPRSADLGLFRDGYTK